MSELNLTHAPVLVVGAGIMGAGIAQVAAQAGHPVWLHDLRDGAAAAAINKLSTTLDGLVIKGRLTPELAQAALQRIQPLPALADAASAGLVVEAIVEDLAAKRALFQQLEAVVSPSAVLATNTSSISVTAIAAGLQHPGRLVGMHFFNPVPLMKLVEVVSGLQTQPAVAEKIFALSKVWGKVPVFARSTPGFIVNRIARPYYAEALALLQQQVTGPAVLDACLRGAGFRMGPCELMDLIGHDTNLAVTQSVFEANFYDKRYQPSVVQREMVDGGLLGRKSGRGFYRYPEGAVALPVVVYESGAALFKDTTEVTVHGDDAIADELEQRATQALAEQGWGPARLRGTGWTGLEIDGARLVLTTGVTASAIAAGLVNGVAARPNEGHIDGAWGAAQRAQTNSETSSHRQDVAVFDRPVAMPCALGTSLAYAVASRASSAWQQQAPAWLAALGFAPQRVADSPGLVVARTVAMLINEAADAVQQGVCSPEGANSAMKMGVSYPAGPFEWLDAWGAGPVCELLGQIDAHYRGERYRVSPWLRQATY